jgi:succinyl-CoA:acetate CoA-transferase
MLKERLRCQKLQGKIISAEEAAQFVEDGMNVGASGFTPAGYPKAVPLAIAARAKRGEKIGITLITGASVGDELDGELAIASVIQRRYPYQTNKEMRDRINDGSIEYVDMHLSQISQCIRNGVFGKIDIAVVEAVAITEEGGIVPSTSVGNSNVLVEEAEKVIVEINTSQPLELEGIHDIYCPADAPHRKPIPILHPVDRIGTSYIPCDTEKIVGIVITDIPDKTRSVAPIDENSRKMAEHLIGALEYEVKKERLPKNLFPLQSGVGSVANAVLGGLAHSNFESLLIYSEVLQDSVLDLIDSGKVSFASATSLTISPERLDDLYKNFHRYREKIILRPQEISNSPEIARRLGVISINTAIEFDIYGNVNSTHIMGSQMMNGIGGAADFTRNGMLTIFATCSTAKDGKISSIVPMVSHHDQSEHSVMMVVTEQGIADLRGKSPKERAREIINNCAHPDYRDMLMDYFERALQGPYKHTPHILNEALSWHDRYLKTGTMKLQ